MRNPLDYLKSRDNIEDKSNEEGILCERLVKNYDGKSIEVSGLNFGGFQLGKFGMEPKLLQTVSHALMLLDASQYDLCNAIRNIKDKETRSNYIKLMTDDKLAAQRIFRALAGLLISPESSQMQEAVKEILLSTLISKETRAMDIENSKVLTEVDQSTSTSTYHIIKEDTIEIGSTSFKEKINDLKQSYPRIGSNVDVKSSSSRANIPLSQKSPTAQVNDQAQEMEGIKNAIIALNNEYTNELINGLNLVEFWSKLGGVLRLLTVTSQYRKVIGTRNAEALDRIIIKIAGKVNEFKDADDLGNKSEANIAKKEATLYFGEVFRRMDDIYSSIEKRP